METEQQPVQLKPKTSRRDYSRWLKLLAILILLLAIGGGGGWWWRDRDAQKSSNAQNAEIAGLKTQLAKAQADLESASQPKAADSQAKTVCSGPTTSQLENIEAAISSGNTAAIESYLRNPTVVILAASEAYGPQTPPQAIKDLDYLDSGTEPWDFSLPTATLTAYQKGAYKQYFTQGSLVGQSANNYVVSFQFDSCGKVYSIFMSPNANLLK